MESHDFIFSQTFLWQYWMLLSYQNYMRQSALRSFWRFILTNESFLTARAVSHANELSHTNQSFCVKIFSRSRGSKIQDPENCRNLQMKSCNIYCISWLCGHQCGSNQCRTILTRQRVQRVQLEKKQEEQEEQAYNHLHCVLQYCNSPYPVLLTVM